MTHSYRLCLIYNLVYKGSGPLPCVRSPDEFDPLLKAIDAWQAHERPHLKFVLPLAHLYTKQGLSFDRLKSQDRKTAEYILAAAKRRDLKVYLGTLEGREGATCSAAQRYWGKRRVPYDSLRWEDVDSSFVMKGLIDPAGNTLDANKLSMSGDEILRSTKEMFDQDSDPSYEGNLGNEGATVRTINRLCTSIYARQRLAPFGYHRMHTARSDLAL